MVSSASGGTFMRIRSSSSAFIGAVLAGSIVLAGCGDSSDDAAEPELTESETTQEDSEPEPGPEPDLEPEPEPEEEATEAADSLNAEQIADGMATILDTIVEVVYITPENDPNGVIGDPGKYISGAVLRDERYYTEGDDLLNVNGATVETFRSQGQAMVRYNNIKKSNETWTLPNGDPIMDDYAGAGISQVGNAVLRVDAGVVPKEEWVKYEAAFYQVLGVDEGRSYYYEGDRKPPQSDDADTQANAEVAAFKGKGDKILKFDSGFFFATITHKGDRNFIVYSLDPELEEQELLVNTIGKYRGTVLAPDDANGGIKIEADGKWTVNVQPISQLPPQTGAISGKGDDVVFWNGPENTIVKIEHSGERNFIVSSYPISGGYDLLVNEIGSYSGEQILDPSVVEIEADGEWRIVPQ